MISADLRDHRTDYGEPNERLTGIYAAVVKQVKDPDNKGRVRVAIPGLAADYLSDWIQVVQADAGPGYGAYFIPEKEDQVVVAFLSGSTRAPVVLGSIYSASYRPLLVRSDDSVPRYFATPGGHLILMEDKSGKRIEIIDATGSNFIRIDTENNKIAITASADIAIEAGANLSLKANGNITIEATGQVVVSGATIALN